MKRLSPLPLCLVLILCLTLTVYAVSPKIIDRADLMTEQQVEALETKVQDLVREYDMDVIILTVYDLEGTDVASYADDYFDENGYGIGPNHSGVLLLIAMDTREWAISTSGDAIYALTDYGIEQLFSAFAGDLSNGRYYQAFNTYLDQLLRYFQAYENGAPIDGRPNTGYDGPGYIDPSDRNDVVYYDPDPDASDYLRITAISLILGAVVGGITILIMRGQMNTATSQKNARSYLIQGSYHLRRSQDIYLYSRVTKVRRPRNNSGGGGSSTHRSSMGHVHGGRSGRF